ncbi:uncharacterized protein BJ171DRAFT_617151 [Polychytrium aggregatum]|uniref:uncharacterized protein n=1 Tax=Polychytrium aggregatum TaxID=110093 RepID=UPI0022FED04E|nr:uncharacterized protein BJ171DRAFT_617151 [Polychytrium aggregatum]KAI9205176.1 hypothetical protein BJ171DRAFT_617151 [Polychytrium aggregatum]
MVFDSSTGMWTPNPLLQSQPDLQRTSMHAVANQTSANTLPNSSTMMSLALSAIVERDEGLRGSLRQMADQYSSLMIPSLLERPQAAVSGNPAATPATNIAVLPPIGNDAKVIRSKVGPVEIRLYTDRTTFVAQGEVTGVLHVQCGSTKGLKIGRIELQLVGYEAIIPSAGTPLALSRRAFFFTKQCLQSVDKAPTDAIVPGTPDEHGMWSARGGLTKLPFSIAIGPGCNSAAQSSGEENAPLPSSFWNRQFGGVRYILSALVFIKIGHNPPTLPPVTAYRELFVLEHTPALLSASFPAFRQTNSPTSATDTQLVGGMLGFGRKGHVQLKAELHVPQPSETYEHLSLGTWVAGGIGFVGVEIKNFSPQKVKELKVALIRRLKTFSQSAPGAKADKGDDVADEREASLLPVSFSRQLVVERSFKAMRQTSSSGALVSRLKYAAEGWAEDGEDVPPKWGWWNGVEPNDSRKVIVDICVPFNVRTIRYGMLIDVSYVVQVVVLLNGGKKLSVDIPVTVLHPASLYSNLPSTQRAVRSGERTSDQSLAQQSASALQISPDQTLQSLADLGRRLSATNLTSTESAGISACMTSPHTASAQRYDQNSHAAIPGNQQGLYTDPSCAAVADVSGNYMHPHAAPVAPTAFVETGGQSLPLPVIETSFSPQSQHISLDAAFPRHNPFLDPESPKHQPNNGKDHPHRDGFAEQGIPDETFVDTHEAWSFGAEQATPMGGRGEVSADAPVLQHVSPAHKIYMHSLMQRASTLPRNSNSNPNQPGSRHNSITGTYYGAQHRSKPPPPPPSASHHGTLYRPGDRSLAKTTRSIEPDDDTFELIQSRREADRLQATTERDQLMSQLLQEANQLSRHAQHTSTAATLPYAEENGSGPGAATADRSAIEKSIDLMFDDVHRLSDEC